MKTTLHHVGSYAPILNGLRTFLTSVSRAFLLISVFFLLISGHLNAQFVASDDWSLYKSIDELNIYAKLQNCPRNAGYDRNNVLLRIKNTGQSAKTVDYHLHLYYNGECKTCDDSYDEYKFSYTIATGEEIVGNCDVSNSGLSLFAGWSEKGISKVDYSGFELALLQVRDEGFSDQELKSKFYQEDLTDLRKYIANLRENLDKTDSSESKNSGSEVSQVSEKELLVAIEVWITRDAMAVSPNELLNPFELTVNEVRLLSAKSLNYVNGHPDRFVIINQK